jgi:hypothetical protein
MVLRRITKHLKDQNWFAVGLDLFIVVFGVGMALYAEQRLSIFQQRAEFTRFENIIKDDLLTTYTLAKERLAVSDCRKNRIAELAKLLTTSVDNWPGSPWTGELGALKHTSTPVIRSPYRFWGSHAWDSALNRNFSDQMNLERYQELDYLFSTLNHLMDLQSSIYIYEAGLKPLSFTMTITSSDRQKYLKTLSELDASSALLEVASNHIIISIENIGFDFNKEGREQIHKNLITQNKTARTVYGECYKHISMPFLETNSAVIKKL